MLGLFGYVTTEMKIGSGGRKGDYQRRKEEMRK